MGVQRLARGLVAVTPPNLHLTLKRPPFFSRSSAKGFRVMALRGPESIR